MSSFSFSGNYAMAETGVFWDLNQCEIPVGLSAKDVMSVIRKNLLALGDKNATHMKMIKDIVLWASGRPEPSTLMLIMGATSFDFLETVEHLKRDKKFLFLYVHPPPPMVISISVDG
ncbi:hypothetical protein DY000_02034087 [Brassica cretica]|uniref:NYN domain-containing protein n=1 Tax=Brassica cretica TaxID=69181 RepID=A0ABQ7DC31_BRACR|nr:hypothetical protein DY000_02034087 [Brassica cretica]